MGLRAAGAAGDRDSPRFWLDLRQGAWAKYVFDPGCGSSRSAASCRRATSPDAPLRRRQGLPGHRQRRIYVARMGANAMRALSLGLGAMEAETPPPFYSFDADIGRLSVSTRRYSAAIVADNRGACPTAGSSWRASSTRWACRSAASAGGPPRASGRRAPAAWPQARARHPGLAASAGLTLARSPRGRGHGRGGCPRAGRRGRSGTWRRSAASRRAAAQSRCAIASPAGLRRARGPCARSRRRLLAEALFPTWGGREASRRRARGRDASSCRRRRRPAAAVRYFTSPARAAATCSCSPAAAGQRAASRASRRRGPGPTLAVAMPGATCARGSRPPRTPSGRRRSRSGSEPSRLAPRARQRARASACSASKRSAYDVVGLLAQHARVRARRRVEDDDLVVRQRPVAADGYPASSEVDGLAADRAPLPAQRARHDLECAAPFSAPPSWPWGIVSRVAAPRNVRC